MKRVFFGIDTSEAARAVAEAHMSKLRAQFPGVRASWVPAANLHVTLKFIGDAYDDQIERMTSQLAPAVQQIEPFAVQLGNAAAFGKRVLAFSVTDGSGMLLASRDLVESACDKAGFPREKRPFKSHLTLARIRDDRGIQPLIKRHSETQIEPVEWHVREIVLYESKLHPTGSVYSKLTTFPLGVT